MSYTIPNMEPSTRNTAVFWGHALVEGGFSDRSYAEDTQEWFQMHYPNGPENVRRVGGWILAP